MGNIDWGAIAFGVVVLGLLALIVKAARKMRKKGAGDTDAKKKTDSPKPTHAKSRPSGAAGTDAPSRSGNDNGDDGDDGDGDDDIADEGLRAKRRVKGRRKDKAAQRRAAARAAVAAKKERDEAEQPAAQSDRAGQRDPAQPSVDDEQAAQAERDRLSRGLARTRGGFIARLGNLFGSKSVFDETMLEEVEEVLFRADIGTRTANELIDSIRKELGKKAGTKPEAVWEHLKKRSAEMVRQEKREFAADKHKPFVLLMIGVNGTGKTTTIGKLAARFKAEGRSVLLAAGDTFRAAAAEQLKVWGERVGFDVVSRPAGADPAAVIVDALKRANDEGTDVVICDTAGRLHTKVDLMEELQKIPRAMAKHAAGAPHETFLVLDATTGQNAIQQAKMFGDVLGVTGLVLTKLDGTAKGGVVLGICNELNLPVRFVGIGEKMDDLRVFDPEAFVDALYARDPGETASN